MFLNSFWNGLRTGLYGLNSVSYRKIKLYLGIFIYNFIAFLSFCWCCLWMLSTLPLAYLQPFRYGVCVSSCVLCMCMYLCICECIVCTCVWRPEADSGCLPQLLLWISVWDRVSSWMWILATCLVWLTHGLSGSASPRLPSVRIIDACCSCQLFKWELRILTQDLRVHNKQTTEPAPLPLDLKFKKKN